MNKTLIIVVSLVVAVFAGLYLVSSNKDKAVTLGGFGESGAISTSTKSANGVVVSSYTMLKTTPGILQSVVVAGATAGQVINLYNATSTLTNVQTGTSTVVTIPSTALGGTYTYNISFSRGLLMEIVGATGTSTITWK